MPTAPAPPVHPPFALWTAIVPVGGAVVLWAVTGSPYALWFAALGPVVAVAALFDGKRSSRRAQRRSRDEYVRQLAEVRDGVQDRHEQERRTLWARHPDVAEFARRPDDVWRPVERRGSLLVIGRGETLSTVRLDGGAGDDDGRELRRVARSLEGAPVVVPARAGIAIVGPAVWSTAVARGLVLQMCLIEPPRRLRLEVAGEPDLAALPHHESPGATSLGLFTAVSAAADAVDIPIVCIGDGPPPPRCAVVVTLVAAGRARVEHGSISTEVEVELVSHDRARDVVRWLIDRAGHMRDRSEEPPALSALLASASASASASGREAPAGDTLPAIVGVDATGPAVVDLVADGPHAVVVGVTGAGKSELLTSWVAALAAIRTPHEVSFLLVDFKGGRTFDALAGLPHVTGVLTDLDEAAAVRAIGSLRAELRHRERVLADVGARDVEEAGDALGRLVVVVDEYAALVAAHPPLHDLFADIAARGRALGMHLILASQRSAGVFRDAVLANAPLRLALRVSDPADSRAVLGVDDAAALSGRPEERGVCLVRGPADAAPRTVRVSRSDPAVLPSILAAGHPPARKPWLPSLPERIEPGNLVTGSPPGAIVLGIADEPDLQRQRPLLLSADEPGLLVLGASGSGRTSVLRAIASQTHHAIVISAEPEEGWDAVGRAEQATPGSVILADDLDLLLARLGADHALVVRDRLEQLARESRSRGIRLIVSAQRPGGAVARVADAIPRRFLLDHASRTDWVAAGGESADYARCRPGRGRCDGILVQSLWVEPQHAPTSEPAVAVETWMPARQPVAFIAPDTSATRATLDRWRSGGVAIDRIDTTGAELRRGGVLWGTPDGWLAQWRLLAGARAEAQLVVDTACASEYRTITGSSEIPPFALPRARRAWLRTPDGSTRRIVLPV